MEFISGSNHDIWLRINSLFQNHMIMAPTLKLWKLMQNHAYKTIHNPSNLMQRHADTIWCTNVMQNIEEAIDLWRKWQVLSIKQRM